MQESQNKMVKKKEVGQQRKKNHRRLNFSELKYKFVIFRNLRDNVN